MRPEERARRRTAVIGSTLLLGGMLCAVVPGFFLVPLAGACQNLGNHGIVFARLSEGLHLPVPIVQNCEHAFTLFVLYYIGFLACAAGMLLIINSRPSIRALATITLLSMTLAIAMPFVPNADPYAYAMSAYESFDLKQSPYVAQHLPLTSAIGAELDALLPEHRNPLRVINYGPVFTMINAVLIGPFGFLSLKAMIYAERIFGALGVLTLGLLLARTQNHALRKRQVFAFIALNPILLFESVSFTHGDIIMLVMLGAAYAAYRHNRIWLSAALCVLAFETRSIALVAGVVLLWDLLNRKRYRDLYAAITAIVGTAFATWLIAERLFGSFGHAFGFFYSSANAPGTALAALSLGDTRQAVFIGLIAGLGIGIAVAYVSLRERLYSLMPVAILVALPGVEPWYAQWLAPVAALTASAPYRVALIAFMLFAPLDTFIEMTVQLNYSLFHGLSVAIKWIVPLLLYCLLTVRRPRVLAYDSPA